MQMVDPRSAMSGAELISHYAAIRKKLFYVPPKKIVMPVAVKRIDPNKKGKRPLWCLKDISFDEHVKIWNKFKKPAKKTEERLYSLSNKPIWMLTPTHFNEHVVAQLRHKLLIEGSEPQDILMERKPIPVIVSEVLRFFDDVTIPELKGVSRRKVYILPRHLAMWEIKRQRQDLSYPAVAKWFGGRDHTVVVHACKKIEGMKERGELDWYFSSKDC